MNKRQSGGRSILFWFFFLSSIPIAIVIISYASGIRVDTHTGSVIENAGISITTKPRGATVLINNTPLTDVTPIVHSLSPGMYTVEIKKEHYSDWKKKITVHHGKSELFSDVILFAQGAPILVDNIPSKPLFHSFDTKIENQHTQVLEGADPLIVDAEHNTAFIVDSLKHMSTLFHIDGTVESAMWNKKNELLYATSNALWVYTPDESPVLLRRQSLHFIDVAWHPENGYVFYSDLSGIYALEVDPRDHRQQWKLADVNDASHLVVSDAGDTLYYTSGDKNYSLQLY